MCGIAGYTGRRVTGLLEAMNSALFHRGPDDDGSFENETMHLTMRRLSIVDLKTGKQPQFNHDKSVAVVFNGEIYNYVELRERLTKEGVRFESESSDTEVIVHLYVKYGISFLKELVGMFAIALFDRKTDNLFLIRDRLGKKSIYYEYDEETKHLRFASEFNALQLKDKRSNLNADVLPWYFSQKTVPKTETIDKRIHKIPPGHYLRFSGGEPQLNSYYSLNEKPERTRIDSEAEAARAVNDLLCESVKLRMRADVEVGAFLSGGVDSSLIVALASQLTAKPLKTYCLTYEEEIYNKSSDRKYAVQMAKTFKTDHREVPLNPQKLIEALPKIVRHHGQPNSSVLSAWFVAQEMKKDIKVALSGDGADEMFGSYFLHRVAPYLGRDRRALESLKGVLPEQEFKFFEACGQMPLEKVIDHFSVFSDQELTRLLKPEFYKSGRILSEIKRALSQVNSKDPLDKMLEFDCKQLLVNQILNYSDLLAMAHSLEVRCPFLDHRLVELAFSLSPELKISNGTTKYILKKVAEKYLPSELIYRPKEGFVEPAIHWLSGPLRDFCLSILSSPEFNRLGYLNGDYVKSTVASFYENSDFFLGKKVWCLLTYALWEKLYDS